MVITYTQITRIRNSNGSETLRRHSDGTTLPYSDANLNTMLTGVTDPLYVLKRVDNNGNPYPSTFQARNRPEFQTADFDTAWNLLLSNPDQPFGKL